MLLRFARIWEGKSNGPNLNLTHSFRDEKDKEEKEYRTWAKIDMGDLGAEWLGNKYDFEKRMKQAKLEANNALDVAIEAACCAQDIAKILFRLKYTESASGEHHFSPKA